MEKRGMNARIQALREMTVTTQPHIDVERAKSETETYKKYEDEYAKIDLVIKRTIAKSFTYYKYDQITKIPDEIDLLSESVLKPILKLTFLLV